MWPSVSTSDSESSGRRAARGAGRARAILLAASLLAALPVPARGGVLVELDDALASAFPDGARFERQTAFLDERQSIVVERLAGSAPPSRIVTYFVALAPRDGGEVVVGFAYVETHLVRTLQETLLIVLDAEGSARRVDVLSFFEPQDYLPSRRWFGQFEGRDLDEGLRLKREIRTLSGATLSSRSATDAVRRALALHRVLNVTGPGH